MLSAWLSPRNGGVYEAVKEQAAILRMAGAVPVMLGIGNPSFDWDSDERLEGAELHRLREAGPEALAYAPDLQRTLHEAELDLLHLHGIWQYPSYAAGEWTRATGCPLLISPHGMLDPWIVRRNGWKKALAIKVWERRCWSRAAAFHALTGAEADDVARHTGKANIAVIPNAASAVPEMQTQDRPPTLFYLGRIHPKKNISALIAGWTAAYPQLPPQAKLIIAGWGAVRDRAIIQQQCEMAPAAYVSEPVYDTAKAEAISSARFLILPSLSEGLPMTVLEAWAHGTPTLMSAACHLPQGFAAGAALDCGTSMDSIARAITTAFTLRDEEWQRMAAAARNLATGPFGRATVAREWERTYARLLQEAPL